MESPRPWASTVRFEQQHPEDIFGSSQPLTRPQRSPVPTHLSKPQQTRKTETERVPGAQQARSSADATRVSPRGRPGPGSPPGSGLSGARGRLSEGIYKWRTERDLGAEGVPAGSEQGKSRDPRPPQTRVPSPSLPTEPHSPADADSTSSRVPQPRRPRRPNCDPGSVGTMPAGRPAAQRAPGARFAWVPGRGNRIIRPIAR